MTGCAEDSVGLKAEFHGRRRVKVEPPLPEGRGRQTRCAALRVSQGPGCSPYGPLMRRTLCRLILPGG